MACPRQCHVCKTLQVAQTGTLGLLREHVKELQERELPIDLEKLKDVISRNMLHRAATGGRTEICNYLVHNPHNGYRHNINTKDKDGWTALHFAIATGHSSTAQYLIWYGADICISDYYGFTPLHLAAERGDIEILEVLISLGANINLMTAHHTPLHVASIRGKKDVVQVLLRHHANPNLIGFNSETPLYMSIKARSLECLELLLKDGADPNINVCGEFPLGFAVLEPHAGMVEHLLKHGADPNATGPSGLTPLELSALNHDHEIMKMLFPVTAPIATYPDWSIRGIVEHIHSQEATEQREIRVFQLHTHRLTLYREKAKDAFETKNYVAAIYWMTMARSITPADTFFYNRSLCWIHLQNGENALQDAVDCVKLNPHSPNAHYREGEAYIILKNYQKAAEAFERALQLDPHNRVFEETLQQAQNLVSEGLGHGYWNPRLLQLLV